MKKLFSVKFLMMLVMPLVFVACSKDDPAPEELVPKLDGVYIYGTNTIAETAVEPAARMALAQLDLNKAPKTKTVDGVYGKFMYIGAGAKIKIANVVSGVATRLGVVGGGKKEKGTDVADNLIPIGNTVIHGDLVADEAEISVTDAGLYFAVVNINKKTVVLAPVTANIIGDATPGNWATGTAIAPKSASKDSTVFESTIKLKGAAGYRYRFHDGWNAYNQEGAATTLSSLGVANYGDSWASGKNPLVFSLENIPNKVAGDIKVKLLYNQATDTWSEFKDLSNVKLGLFGNAYKIGDKQAAWDTPYDVKAPTRSGSKFIWKWTDAELIADGEFVFLQDGAWGGWFLDYTVPNSVGGAAVTEGKIKNAKDVGGADANYRVITAGKYDVTVTVDAKEGGTTVSFVAK
ncbi:hypothetical protein [Chryseolinea lacunae]|uniref:DUF5115 domain-containing protein n=1 Tax=Chryseolinea lacunae TaxID=2801331 RepID=A0ABS1KYG9_9BACT|nr:hypothetical protein [Chryseolinea lacunae]MBL0744459.1 hypothetical protein [Chryseolinea lacunae]